MKDYEEPDKALQKIYDESIAIYRDDKEFNTDLSGLGSHFGMLTSGQFGLQLKPTAVHLGTAERMCIPIELEALTRQRIQQLLTWRLN